MSLLQHSCSRFFARPPVRAALTMVTSIAASTIANAQAGQLDPTFGVDGIAPAGGQDLTVADLALQANGRIVVAGTARGSAWNDDHVIAYRYDETGALDLAFGDQGTAIHPLPEGLYSSNILGNHGIALDAEGRIVIALTGLYESDPSTPGFFNNPSPPIPGAVARLLPDGSLDLTFGTSGFAVRSPLPIGGNSWTSAMTIDQLGRIIVIGEYWQLGAPDAVYVACYSPDGTPDMTFGGSGLVSLPQPPGAQWQCAAVDHDGSILMGTWSSSLGSMTFTRLTSSGALDPSFGDQGTIEIVDGLGRSFRYLGSIAIDSARRIVVCGEIGEPSPFGDSSFSDMFVARFLPDGSFDSTFGVMGLVAVDFDGGQDWADQLVIDATDGVTVAATASVGGSGQYQAGLARLDVNGDLDSAFGVGGRVTTNLGGTNSSAYYITVDPLGRLVVLAWTDTNVVWRLLRYIGVNSAPVLLEWLVDDVIVDLVETSAVSPGVGTSLQSKLQASIQQLDNGHEEPAINQMQAFINQLQARVSSGQLTHMQAQPLIDLANVTISLIVP